MKLLIYFLYIFNAMLNSSGIKKMIMLREGFEIITLQRGNIENNTIIFFKILFVINSYGIRLYHVGCVIFCMRRKKI
jgi:hypothetical protein